MAALDKLERVRAALTRFVERLRPEDRVALIAFSDEARVVAPLSARGDGKALRDALGGLQAEGSTNLHAGLVLGLGELERGAGEERVARVLLLTDGMANVGVTDPDEIVRHAKEHQGREGRGIDLSTIGFGLEIDRALLARLAEGGHGLAHFIGDDGDIAKVFEREAQSLLAPVARDIELELSWPHGLALERAYGYAPVQDGDRLRIGLDDLNAGATEVVLASFTRAGAGPATITARLSFFDVARGERRTLLADATFQPARAAGAEIVADHEVRKNLTIAALATSLRTMAEQHAAGDDPAAAATLRDALAITRRHHPRLEDEDIRRTYELCGRTLDVLCPPAVARSGDAWGPLR
jgi:Ca-activated chloride channel family protein